MKEQLLQNMQPVKVGKLPAFLKAIVPLFNLLKNDDLQSGLDGAFVAALAENVEPLAEAVCLGSGAQREWLDEQGVDVLVGLAARVIEVNADFFAQVLGAMSLPAPQNGSQTGGESA